MRLVGRGKGHWNQEREGTGNRRPHKEGSCAWEMQRGAGCMCGIGKPGGARGRGRRRAGETSGTKCTHENDCNGDLRAKWGFEGSNRGPTRPLLLTQVLKFGFEGLSRGYIRVALRCTMAIRCLLHLIVPPFRPLSAELYCTFLQVGKVELAGN
jgi:hypothetical protein